MVTDNPNIASTTSVEVTRTSTINGRLQWLLQGVLEVQSLVTDAKFDLSSFMQRVVDLAENLTNAKGAVIELVEGDEMVYRSASISIREHVGLRLRRSGSLSGLCVAQAQVLRCDDTETDSRVDKVACRKVGVRSMLCTPLSENGRAVGVLKVMDGEVGAFDADDEQLLNLLAGALGAALGRQLVMQELKVSEELFRTAMEIAPIGQALVRLDGCFLKVNAALCELMGYSEAELLSKDFQTLTHPEDLDRDLQLLKQCLTGEIDRYRMEKRYFHKTGRVIWILLSVALVRDRGGNPHYFIAQIHDITEQREMERIKSEFISMVSHELRTPLTSIRGSLGLVLGTQAEFLPPKVKRLLEIANGNCDRLILLVNDILDIEKMTSGHMQFDIKSIKLNDVLFEAVHAVEGYVEKMNVKLVLRPPADEVRINVDERRLLQVLTNLLSNAAKFSPQDGEVRIGAEVTANQVRITIADSGPGIPENFRERIFGKFSQADSSSTRSAGGTGLGLHISRQIVRCMQGQIGFDTEVGIGTTFWMEFARS